MRIVKGVECFGIDKRFDKFCNRRCGVDDNIVMWVYGWLSYREFFVVVL